jgi:hypothetical protein
VGVAVAAGSGLPVDVGCQGLSWRESPATSMTAARSCWSQASGTRPYCACPTAGSMGRPARQVSDSASGNRARQSPSSAAARRRAPGRIGQGGEDGRIGTVPSRWMTSPSSSSIWARTVSRAATSPGSRWLGLGLRGRSARPGRRPAARAARPRPCGRGSRCGAGTPPGGPRSARPPGSLREAAQEGQRDRAVDLAEQRGGAGKAISRLPGVRWPAPPGWPPATCGPADHPQGGGLGASGTSGTLPDCRALGSAASPTPAPTSPQPTPAASPPAAWSRVAAVVAGLLLLVAGVAVGLRRRPATTAH